MLKIKHLHSLFKKLNIYFRSKLSLKFFVTYILIISIPVALFGLISYMLSSSNIESDYIKFKGKLNEQLIINIEKNLTAIDKQSMSAFFMLEDMNKLIDESIDSNYLAINSNISSYFLSTLKSNDLISGITIFDLNGTAILYINDKMNSSNSIPVKNEKWFSDTLALNGYPLFIEPHINNYMRLSYPGEKRKFVSIARSIINYSDDVKANGVLVFDQDVDILWKPIKDYEIDNGEVILVCGKKGDILYSTSGLNNIPIHKIFPLLEYKSKIGTLKYTINGKNMLINYGNSKYGLTVVSLIPYSVLQQKSRFIKDINITLLIIILVASLSFSILFSNLISKPVKRLLNSFNKLKHGNFDTSLKAKGYDEFSQIEASFNEVVVSIKELIQQKYEVNLLRKQAMLESLQSQVNPHFLFNTLNSIKAVSDIEGSEKISEMVMSLSNIFRYSLNHGQYIVKFSDEIDNIKKYLYLQKCRFGDKYQINYDLGDDVMDMEIVRLTLQPLVENALYHGLESSRGNGELNITANAVMDKFYIYITNNGVPIPVEELERINNLLEINPDEQQNTNPDKLGIYNVNSRIKFHFGNEYGLKLYSSQDGYTTVKITLPANDSSI